MNANQCIGNGYVGGDGAMQVNTWVGEYFANSEGICIPGA